MTMNPTHQTILDFLSQQQPNQTLPALKLEDNLLEKELLTSLDFIELIQVLEEKSGKTIDFTSVDPATLVTLEGLIAAFS